MHENVFSFSSPFPPSIKSDENKNSTLKANLSQKKQRNLIWDGVEKAGKVWASEGTEGWL